MAPARKRFEELAEHLELAIFSGRLSVGDKIPSERALMDQFGVGRSTVREALFMLQRKGLLETRPGAAARVSRPDANTLVDDLSGAARHMLTQTDGVRDLQNARTLFEIGLARHAAKHATAEDLKALKAALDANGAAEDQPTFERTDLTFHYTLAMITHNPVFTALHHALMAWLAEQRSVSARAGATRSEIFEQHRAIYTAIAAGDPVVAEEAMETHLATVAHYYWQGVGPSGARPESRRRAEPQAI
ncbi:FCD domain-containing protein [Bauldia litoralis]|uniref:FCD domain-containing protein n=1 Tax=Bauldia litoralis TaxID=665467 RepID=UPI0032657266